MASLYLKMIENKVMYLPLNNVLNQQYNIGNVVGFSIGYALLEREMGQQMLQEPEDLPESLHTPWGVWLHKRDPLHSIHQRFDTAHVIRVTRAAEDILHYAYYVPIVEGPEHEHAIPSYELKFDYSPFNEPKIYNAEIAFESKRRIKPVVAIKPNVLSEEKEERVSEERAAEDILGIAEDPGKAKHTKSLSSKLKSVKCAYNGSELEMQIVTLLIKKIFGSKLSNSSG